MSQSKTTKKYSVHASVAGSKYLGVFEAENEEAAIELALRSDAAYIALCHQCAGECEDGEVTNLTASLEDEQ
jgi:hypothetical protein